MSKKKIEDIIENIDTSKTEVEKDKEIDELFLLTNKIKELEDRALRSQSEFQNYKRRTEEERMQYITQANNYLIEQILPVLDNFDRALNTNADKELESYFEGFKLIRKNMIEVLTNEGLKEIEALGKTFDPNIHQAVTTDHDETKETDIILEVLQKGYTLNGKVLRPAMVKVNK